ncbi:c-type cytochrome [Janthinobacterium sp. J1-1]|uniref:c-type cytochrome n=1 Tax=Janthinobacterium sp. J1-1 TaxID=3065910 RepID=UPI0028111220|nr:c-type cytochrome [Janthinobacterium sp. J1-1]
MRKPLIDCRPYARLTCLLGCALLASACDMRDMPAPPASATPLGNAERGQRLLAQFQCGACHQIPDVPAARSYMGPSLANMGKQSYIAGQFPNQPETLVRWIVDPQAMQPGALMPAMGVSADQARDMAAYLYGLP